MVVTYKDRYKMLLYALHTYHTTVKTFIGATPYSLVYKMKAMILLKIKITSLKVLKNTELEESELKTLKFKQLKLISEKTFTTISHHQLY